MGLLCFFSLVLHFEKQTLNMWDEATYANNAIDMYEAPSLVIKTNGLVDLYNTKPPLAIGFQALSISVFGINTFAIRLPSILFAIFVVFSLYFFSIKVLKNPWIGFIGGVILVSTLGYIRNHVALTADLDSILCFFLTVSFLHGLYVLLENKTSVKQLFLFGILVFGAFLTKGVAAFFHFPALFLLALIYNREIFHQKRTYISAFVLIASCFLYYLLREILEPGYLNIVFTSEISRINTVVMEWQIRPFFFYLSNFHKGYFTPFLYLMPLGILLFIQDSPYKKYAIGLAIGILSYFSIVSIPQVKLDWYDAPLYPLMALFVSMIVYQYCQFLPNKNFKIAAALILIGLLSASNLKQIIESKYKTELQVEALEREGNFLDILSKSHPQHTQITVWKKEATEEHYDHVLFYKRALEKEKNYAIKLVEEGNFKESEKVLVSQQELKDSLTQQYKTIELAHDSASMSYLLEITSPL